MLVVPVDRKEDLKGRRELDEAAQDALASFPDEEIVVLDLTALSTGGAFVSSES